MVINPGFSFQEVANREFWFSSGAGGWATVLYIEEDGSFYGQYHDSEMGSTGPGYENGSMYFCEFYGQFTDPVSVDDFTYEVEIESIGFDEVPDTEEIIDGIRYIYTTPYGLDDASTLYFYMPGVPLEELPEEYLSWVHYYDLTETDDTVLPYYGLYNVDAQTGFSSYEMEDEDEDPIDQELAALEDEAEEMEQYANENLYAQQDLNHYAYQLYKLWDDELNDIWIRMKIVLDENTMAQITQEELQWIEEKEAEIKLAGKEAEGGSMQPMLEYLRGAELTRLRVYELANYLR